MMAATQLVLNSRFEGTTMMEWKGRQKLIFVKISLNGLLKLFVQSQHRGYRLG